MASPKLDHHSKTMITGVSDPQREEARSNEGFRGILHEPRHPTLLPRTSGPDQITHTNPITMNRPTLSPSSAPEEGKANAASDVAKSPPIQGARPLSFTALNQPFNHGGHTKLGTSLPPFSKTAAYQSTISPAPFPSTSELPAPNHNSPPEPRHRIPSMQSTSPRMPPTGLLSSSARATSPSPASSARLDYSTSTPHVGRHIPPRASVDHTLSPKSSSATATARRSGSPSVSPSISSSTLSPRAGSSSMIMDPANSPVPALQPASPPLNDTELFHQIVSAEGSPVRPEIHARVDKGFFLSDRDWTCYRRNYFSVVCSYSLLPSNFPAPLYLRRSSGNGQAEQILGFAVKISAAVHGVAGKPVELVQHTPKRDKGPQLQPALIKLNPQPVGGGSVGPTLHGQSRSMVGSEYDYGYPQSHHMAQQQHVALYDRIQFKSATANNGKRRAAQQYYNLIVELYADVGIPAHSMTSPHGGDNSWVKIAHRVSAPMVVRGRSPGHYVDERKTRPSSAGPEGGNGNNQPPTPGPHHYPPPSLLSHDPHGYFPHKHALGSTTSDPHEHLLNPVISDADHQALNPDMPYSYFPAPLATLDLSHHSSQPFNGFFEPLHAERSLYPPPSTSRSRYQREELSGPSWMSSGREEQRLENLRKCERFHSSDSSSPYYPPPNSLRTDLLL